MAFDRKVFRASDLFAAVDWKTYESYWMIVDGTKAGCCAFEKHVDFQEDTNVSGVNPYRKGSLYISTTGILPEFQGQGFGTLLKCWELCYARHHGFTRIVTNMRARNAAMIELNRRFGFRVIRTTPRYYSYPADSTIVMELRLRGT
jgi:ribosomal protein S18 acetylase RimI-like enzyme